MQRSGRRGAGGREAAAIAAGVALLAGPSSVAHALDVPAWAKDRSEKFAGFKASHPPQEPAIAGIRAKTAAMIAAAAPFSPGALDQPPLIWRTDATPVVVFDIPVGPRMVVVPAGEFTMGSPDGEPGRAPSEAPRHRVRIGHAFAVSMFPITYGEYAEFVAETGRRSSEPCVMPQSGRFEPRKGADWDHTGFEQSRLSAATCISFDDATAYAAWLSAKSGQRYRLLSEAEYEYADRAGTTTAYWWGGDGDAGCGVANGFDQDAKPSAASLTASTCHDGNVFTRPLDQSKPNPFGLYDTAGNVASWTSDCWHASYAGAPSDGAARTAGDCRSRVLRGGSWADGPAGLRAASRAEAAVRRPDLRHGFRVARDL